MQCFSTSKKVKQLRGSERAREKRGGRVGGSERGTIVMSKQLLFPLCHHHHQSPTPSHSTCESLLPRHTAIPHTATQGDNIFTGRRMTSVSSFSVWGVGVGRMAISTFTVRRTTSTAILHPQAANFPGGWLGCGSQGQANNPMSQSQES